MTSSYTSEQQIFVEQGNFSNRSRRERADLLESEAIRRAQRGDEEGFERIYQLHGRRVYALCLRMLGNAAEAEDLTQEAFLTVLRKIKTFRGESVFHLVAPDCGECGPDARSQENFAENLTRNYQ